jgi:hypothetical protein
VKSHRSARGNCTKRVGHQFREGDQETIRFLYFCMVDCSRIYSWIYMFNWVSKLIVLALLDD